MANTNQVSSNANDIEAQLKAAQLRRLLKEEAEAEKAEADFEAAQRKRKATILQEVEVAKQAAEEKRWKQEHCPHCAKDVSFIRGQWLGSRKTKDGQFIRGFLAFCQICLKEYHSIEDIPQHLRSDSDFFGGPKNY